MTLTGAQVFDYIRHALGADVSSELSMQRIANDAGSWLARAEDWRWKMRTPYTAAIVAGQSYIALPPDFAELVADPSNSSFTASPSEMSAIASKRRIANPGGFGFWYAIGYAPGVGNVPPRPRLEIWPPQQAASTIDIYYKCGWQRIAQDRDTVSIPEHMEGLYLTVARAWAQGLEDEEVMSLEDRLQRIKDGPVWAACWESDQSEQTDYGRLDYGPAAEDHDVAADHDSAHITVTLP